MKKILCLLLAVGCVLFSGCGSEESVSTVTQSTITENEISTSDEPSAVTEDEGKPDEVENPDFRNVKWGMSMDEVIKHEKLTLTSASMMVAALGETVSVCGHDMTLCYLFNSNDELWMASYILGEDAYSNANMYVYAFDDVLAGLKDKYGKPTESKDIWLDSSFKDNPDNYGLAVSMGHYRRVATWDVPNTHIQLALIGNKFKISLGVTYTSTEFSADEEESVL